MAITLRDYNGRPLDVGVSGAPSEGTYEYSKNSCVELDSNGEDLYIAYLDGNGTEYVFWFKKCMFNELYTFYRVGYRASDSNMPDTEGIKREIGITWLNKTASDNIGPLSTSNGGWTGGNHSWKDDNVTKTAKTESFNISADGVKLHPSDKKYCNRVEVSVVNSIFDPSVAPEDGANILSSLFSTEQVYYVVEKSSINVTVRQQLSDSTNRLYFYYGMQSMFYNETHLLVPNGQHPDWEGINNSTSVKFNKADYPKINRFIEKNNDGYQSSYLLPNKLGTHDKTSIGIFNHSYTKSYHILINNVAHVIPLGGSVVWSGVYTFFKNPIVDNDDVFAYQGCVHGKDMIFVWAKRQFDGNIHMPMSTQMREIKTIEKDETIETDNTFVDAEGVHINASGQGSFIFALE